MSVPPTSVMISASSLEAGCLLARLSTVQLWSEAFDNTYWANPSRSPFDVASMLALQHATLDFAHLAGPAAIEPDPARRRMLLFSSMWTLVVTMRTVLRPAMLGLAGVRSQVTSAFGCTIASEEATAVFHSVVGPAGYVVRGSPENRR